MTAPLRAPRPGGATSPRGSPMEAAPQRARGRDVWAHDRVTSAPTDPRGGSCSYGRTEGLDMAELATSGAIHLGVPQMVMLSSPLSAVMREMPKSAIPSHPSVAAEAEPHRRVSG